MDINRTKDALLTWVRDRRTGWVSSLKALRSGVLGTSELRNGKRIDTTLETIAEQRKDLADLDAAIIQREADRASDEPGGTGAHPGR